MRSRVEESEVSRENTVAQEEGSILLDLERIGGREQLPLGCVRFRYAWNKDATCPNYDAFIE